MDLARALEFAAGRHDGVLTTVKADGRPHLANVSYLASGDEARISTTDGRAKVRNLRRDPRASLYVPGDDFWHWVVLEGTTELSPVAGASDDATVAQLVDLYRAVGGEHPDWDEYRRAMVSDRRLVVHLRVERAYGMLDA